MIVAFPGHKLHGRWCCDGGLGDVPDACTACVLSLCTVCGGAEASLPTDCPGRRMTTTELDEVQEQLLDYRQERGWVTPVPEWSAGLRRRSDPDEGNPPPRAA